MDTASSPNSKSVLLPREDSLRSLRSLRSSTKTLSSEYSGRKLPSQPPSTILGDVKEKKSFNQFIKGMIEAFMAFGLADKIKAEELNKFNGIFDAPKIEDTQLDAIKEDILKQHTKFNTKNADTDVKGDVSQRLVPIDPRLLGDDVRIRSKGYIGGDKRRRSIKRKHRSIRDNTLGAKNK
jgi:hypothetical protein